jgi:hypothetical protein
VFCIGSSLRRWRLAPGVDVPLLTSVLKDSQAAWPRVVNQDQSSKDQKGEVEPVAAPLARRQCRSTCTASAWASMPMSAPSARRSG